MNDSIEAAARSQILGEEPDAQVACLLHTPSTVIHPAKSPCPLCIAKLDPAALVRAIHALSRAPAPVKELLEAIEAMKPFTAQLGGREIQAYGHTVGDVVRLGWAQAWLQQWIDGRLE